MTKIFEEGVFIVAEISANHNGSLLRAKEIIKAAAQSGANAVKLQTYTADTMTLDLSQECFKIKNGSLWDGRTLYDLYKEAATPWEWHGELFACAKESGILCFSTPFDKTAVDFLEQFNPCAVKIASFETADVNLIEYAASKGRPMFISTGLSDEAEIMRATAVCRKAGNNDITLLKCVSDYPADPSEMNLLAISDMAKKFKANVGFSDHSMALEPVIAAVALGAKIIEKHFTLSRADKGPDSAFSLEPAEFKKMADAVRITEKTLGIPVYGPSGKSAKNTCFKRSLFVVEDIKKGGVFTEENLRSIRPGNGMEPRFYSSVLGKKAAADITKGTPLSKDLIEDFNAQF